MRFFPTMLDECGSHVVGTVDVAIDAKMNPMDLDRHRRADADDQPFAEAGDKARGQTRAEALGLIK